MIRRLLRASALAGSLAVPVVLFGSVAPASAGGFCHEKVTTGKVTEVQTLGGCFAPMVTHVTTGSTVVVHAGDDIAHTIAQPGGEPEELRLGHDVSWSFPEAGVYPYFCLIHPGMVGVVVVDDVAPGVATGAAPAPPGAATDPAPSVLAAAVTPPASKDRSDATALAVVAIAAVALGAGAIVFAASRRRTG